jgi:hypothetical protein
MTGGIVVEVSARRFAVPYECPCCGAAPDAELSIPLTPDRARPASPETAHALGFPYCRRCISHVARWDSIKNVETAIKVLGLLGAIVLGLVVHWAVGIAIFVVAVALALVIGRSSRAKAKAECGESCATPTIAVHYLGWSGNASAFKFESHVYAARFAEQNPTKLANVDPVLRKVMEGHKLARLAVPTPAAAIRAVPAAATVGEWIDRINTASGRVARLDWVVRSLDAFSDPGDRRALIEAAAKLELASISADQPQQIQKAIIAARADNIPEELRDEIVRQLEARLR